MYCIYVHTYTWYMLYVPLGIGNVFFCPSILLLDFFPSSFSFLSSDKFLFLIFYFFLIRCVYEI